MSLEIWSFVVDVLSLIATVVLTVAIYWLQRSHEKEREQMEVEAQKKAAAEAARVFLIDNEDEIEYLPLSAIAKSLKLKRKHHRAITTKFLRCSEEVQKEILKQANFQPIEVSKEQISAALKLLKDDIKTYYFGRDVLYGGAKYFHWGMERNRQISRRIKKHLWLSNRSWARDVHSFGILHSWGALAGKSCSAQASSIWLIAGAFRRTQSK